MKKESKRKVMRLMLGEVLFSLMEQKSIEKITVTEICQQAGINRGTFYAYFLDPRDLLSSFEDELYDQLMIIAKKPSSLEKRTIKDYLRQQFDLYYDHKELMQAVLGEFGDRKFLMKCASIEHDAVIEDWQQKLSEPEKANVEYIYAYFFNGCLGILEMWIKGNFRESPAEMASLVARFFTDSLGVYFK